MQVEMKDIESGTKTNQRIRTEDKVERAVVDSREMQYLYSEADSFIFMDKDNYEQMTDADLGGQNFRHWLVYGEKGRDSILKAAWP